MFRIKHFHRFPSSTLSPHAICQCVCVCVCVCLTEYVSQWVLSCLSEVCVGLEKTERRETESTAERESESLLPTIPHVAQLPFKHCKQASGVMSRREGWWWWGLPC